ncbi:MAG: hypothetical protein IT381_03050 [Deltaproteobacteria bacterium]|nr:hypothetical protein [Deltaproteobacteria bacterium]
MNKSSLEQRGLARPRSSLSRLRIAARDNALMNIRGNGFKVSDLENATVKVDKRLKETTLQTRYGDIVYEHARFKEQGVLFNDGRMGGRSMDVVTRATFAGAAMVVMMDPNTPEKKKQVLTSVLRAMFS